MTNRPKITLITLAAALAGLAGAGAATAPSRAAVSAEAPPRDKTGQPIGEPNRFVEVGDDLLGFIVTERSDGTVEARHYSHRSHSSHRSHYSSRY